MSVSKNSFLRSNAFGNSGESYVSTYLVDRGIGCIKDNSPDKRYDHDLVASIDDTRFTLEVKYDMMAKRTGNIAIEYHNAKKNKPSGIFATKADFWTILLNTGTEFEIHVAPTNKLIEFISTVEPKRIVYAGGDDNADLLLYTKEDILPVVFTLINEVDDIRRFFLDNLTKTPPTIND